MSPRDRTITGRAAAVLPVLLLHLALLWLLVQSHPSRVNLIGAPTRQPMVLLWVEAAKLLPALPVPTLPEALPETAPWPPSRAVSRSITSMATAAISITQPPEATALQSPSRVTQITPETPAISPPPAPNTSSATPLDLTLRRSASSPALSRSAASFATQDSRANSEHVGFGEKLAEALGSAERRSEENLGDGRI
jgi:hypothetical protein